VLGTAAGFPVWSAVRLPVSQGYRVPGPPVALHCPENLPAVVVVDRAAPAARTGLTGTVAVTRINSTASSSVVGLGVADAIKC